METKENRALMISHINLAPVKAFAPVRSQEPRTQDLAGRRQAAAPQIPVGVGEVS